MRFVAMTSFATMVILLAPAFLLQATAQPRPIVAGLTNREVSEEARRAAEEHRAAVDAQNKRLQEQKAQAEKEARIAEEAVAAAQAKLEKEQQAVAQTADEASKAAAQKLLDDAKLQLDETRKRSSVAQSNVELYSEQLRVMQATRDLLDVLLVSFQIHAREERTSFGLGIASLAFGLLLAAIVATVLLKKLQWDVLAFKLFGIAVVVSASAFLLNDAQGKLLSADPIRPSGSGSAGCVVRGPDCGVRSQCCPSVARRRPAGRLPGGPTWRLSKRAPLG